MKRFAWLAAAAAGIAVALAIAGAAAALVTPSTITLVAPPYVATDSTFALTGVTTPPNSHVDLWQWSNATCSGERSNWWHHGSSDGTTGAYSHTVTAPVTAGIYSYKAEIYSNIAWSPCVVVYVGIPLPTAAPTSSGPDRYGYCSVTGNTNPDGTPIAPGTFLNLLQGQPGGDKNYTGATPAFWVQGVGITCDLSPAQQAIAAASTTKVNHVGETTPDEGPPFYTYVPSP